MDTEDFKKYKGLVAQVVDRYCDSIETPLILAWDQVRLLPGPTDVEAPWFSGVNAIASELVDEFRPIARPLV